MIDGQAQKMVLLVDDLPANTTCKSAQLKNTQAKVLYKQTGNNYTTTLPGDLSKVESIGGRLSTNRRQYNRTG